MRRSRLHWILVLGLLGVARTHGMYAWYETRQVPIDRLLRNLGEQWAANTNDFLLTYQLARLHDMAYAANVETLEVRNKDGTIQFASPGSDRGVPEQVTPRATPAERETASRHLTNALALHERSLKLLRASTNLDQQRWLILPAELGLAWSLDQAGRRDEALNHYRRVLKAAWKMEVTGDFSFKEWLSDAWNDVRSGQNPLHSRPQGHLGPGVCFSEETIGYLLKLLDPVKDAAEIARLKARQQTLMGMGRAITPILVPLAPNVAWSELVDPSAGVLFDLDGSGHQRRWGWITPRAAWLVYDASGDGRITSALQMFGHVTFWIFWCDGYDALASLDDDHDGVLRGGELPGLALWQDRNGNGVSEPGEVRPLAAFGIVGLSCRGGEARDGVLWNPSGVLLANGETRPSYDWVVTTPAAEAQPNPHGRIQRRGR